MPNAAKQAMIDGYLACVAWLMEGDDEFEGASFSPEFIAKATADCTAFEAAHAEILETAQEHGYTDARAGHDLWLTRNGHGAGFWDRKELEFPSGAETAGAVLSAAARGLGESEPYVGDDGLIYS